MLEKCKKGKQWAEKQYAVCKIKKAGRKTITAQYYSYFLIPIPYFVQMLIVTLWNEGKYFIFNAELRACSVTNHHVHITECIFKLLVSLHYHMPLYRKFNLIFFGLSWGYLVLHRTIDTADTPGLSSKPPLPSELLLLGVPPLSLLPYQTSSDIRFGDRNLAILVCAHITDCLLRKEYSVQLTIM